MRGSLSDRLWYGRERRLVPLMLALLPLSALFALLSIVRRGLYKRGILRSVKLNVPVIIIGGITVGGAGKTPLAIALIRYLSARGYKVGLISRGYRGRAPAYPLLVTEDSAAGESGDEPLLIKLAVGERALVMTDPVRERGARRLEELGCQVILSDDGLQHYALKRDFEIAVLDGRRLTGNGLYLPAGPLREGRGRLKSVDAVIVNGGSAAGCFSFSLRPSPPVSLATGEELGAREITALAGIGNPGRFYATCESLGFRIAGTLAAGDHAALPERALRDAAAARPVVMTAKDAVKYRGLDLDGLYVIRVEAEVEEAFFTHILSCLEDRH